MLEPKPYKGDQLAGQWLITRKLDGVRMLRGADGAPVTRGGNSLFNLDHIPQDIKDAEIYAGTVESSFSAVTTKCADPVPLESVYSIEPTDPRLIITTLTDPEPDQLQALMEQEISAGNEGLVIRQGSEAYKLKPSENYDVKVLGFKPGKGEFQGVIGSLITEKGNVSAGLTMEQRREYMHRLPQIIEVECMQLKKSGKFRHPRFIRQRVDLETPELEQTKPPAKEENQTSEKTGLSLPAILCVLFAVLSAMSAINYTFKGNFLIAAALWILLAVLIAMIEALTNSDEIEA